ncbi:hypothetical protein ACFPIJ_11650 [Dactylosporangium cerinum]|uniref:Uncharacterized protein n=1 Tax=Dactylosporangium cerinum TaxID=1434730 RepID=A0ABV9VT88_9ACTN
MTGTLLFIVGPPAVGKMTVGEQIAARTGLRLFHNHMAIELVLRFFPFGSPPFGRLVDRFRRDLIEEVAASDLPGLRVPQLPVLAHEASRPEVHQGQMILASGHAAGRTLRLGSDRRAAYPVPAPYSADLTPSSASLATDRRTGFGHSVGVAMTRIDQRVENQPSSAARSPVGQ